MRFSFEVLAAVRAAVPADFIVGARVSGDDRVRFGLEPGELLEIIARHAASGLLDYLTVTGGTISTFRSRSYNIPTQYEERGTFVPLARRVRERVTIPVIVTGRIVTPEHAEAVLASGDADFVGMTRALIADPELPRKAAAGRDGEIRTCMSTGEGCIDRLYFGFPIACVQNAVIGREQTWGTLAPAATRKRVAVVGGGPAGLEAARVAAERGHSVVLFEREGETGGAIRIAARAPGWSAYRSSIEWLAAAVARAGVEVKLACEADATSLAELAPDAVVFATGARPRKPYLPGAQGANVITASDAIAGDVPAGARCVVLDEVGYTIGPKAADALATRGARVTIVTRQYALGEDIGTTLRAALIERLLRAGVEIVTLAIPLEIVADGVRVAHTLTDAERFIEADTVVVASGGVSDDALYRACGERFAERYLIGDAFAPRQLRAAISDGARIGRAL
jgi:NADPH-dependent 2,4-dienoyl-CoA reductase/sulfur reductase-like enzyme